MGAGQIQLGRKLEYSFLLYIPFPKFRVLRHLGEGREGGQSFPARQPLKHLQVATGKDVFFDAPSEVEA